MGSKECFWVFSGNDLNLKVWDKKEGSYVMIGNKGKRERMNSGLNGVMIKGLSRVVNRKGK